MNDLLIYLLIYLLLVILTWGLLKLSLKIESDLAPVPFFIIVFMFVPIINLIISLTIFGLSIYAKYHLYFNEDIKDKIVNFLRLDK
jgi:hypothetical protein